MKDILWGFKIGLGFWLANAALNLILRVIADLARRLGG